MNSGLTSHQQRGHTETRPRFKVSSERPEKRGIDLATPVFHIRTIPTVMLTVLKQSKTFSLTVELTKY